MENHRKEIKFISESILYSILRGVLVGAVVGLVVVAFRLAIEEVFHLVTGFYEKAHQEPIYLFYLPLSYLLIAYVVGKMIQQEPNAKGSGIPQVEAELKGMMQTNWWSILWRKFIGGVLAIASGLMLGREGPSIQLGAVTGKGVAQWLRTSEMEKRSLIASGAAAGLAAAFNAPIAGLLFVVEEIYHQFSRLVWVSALAASITANFLSLHMFGLTPVLDMPDNLAILGLNQYWVYILLGIFLGLAGYCYEMVILHIQYFYDFLGRLLPIQSHYHSLFAFVLILPVGYFFPQLLGGGHHLILDLAVKSPSLQLVMLYLVIRFIWSMISYGSGLPGGIFLPILTLGSLLGMLAGRLAFVAGWIAHDEIALFIILGMTGFFAAISKAPLTAMILVTEMVGDMRQLMIIGLVALTAYVVMDLAGGAPIYEAMLEKILPEHIEQDSKMTLIEVVVSEHLANRFVSDLHLPHNSLITSQIHHGRSQVVKGNSRLHLGDSIYVAVPVSDMQQIRQILEGSHDETRALFP